MTTTTQAQPNEIQNIITEVGLEKTTSNKIEICFMPFLQKIQEWEDKAKDLKNAPDVVKLLKYATDIEAVDFPLLADPKAQAIANNARQLLAKVSVYIKSNTKSLAS